jgi:hypothetical protein
VTQARPTEPLVWLANVKKSSPLKLLGQMNRNLIGSIYVRSSIKFLHFVPFGQQIWLPRAILVFDWLVYGKFYVHDFLLIIDYGINIDIVSVFNIISYSYSTCRQGIKKGHNSKLYRKLYTAVQSSPIIRNLTGQFSLSKFGLKEARIRPKLCRHKMPTWLSLRVIYTRMAGQS